jgi:hypothetical protein
MLSNKHMDIDDLRRLNIRSLEQEAGSPSAIADKVGMSYAQYINTRDGAKEAKTGKRRGMRKETAWRFEDAFSRPRGWLDIDHDAHTIDDLAKSLGQQILGASPEVQSVIRSLILRYETDPSRGDETARAIKTLLGITAVRLKEE